MRRYRRNVGGTTVDVLPTDPSPTNLSSSDDTFTRYMMKIQYPNGKTHSVNCKDVDEAYSIVEWGMKDSTVPEGTIFHLIRSKEERKWIRQSGLLVVVRG